jgi:hypothetical protein
MYRLISNTMTTLLQWKRNFHSAGLHWLNEDVPDCYIKAAEIAEQTQKLIAEDPRYAGYTLTMTGHSKGGAEAAYATLNHPSIPAFCFATPPLGNRLIKTIRPENIALAKENIHHYFVKHDVVPSLVKIPKYFWNISHIGKGRWLPAPAHIVSGPLIYFLAHMSFHECITDHTEEHFHKATDPVVKTEDDNNTDINSDDTNQIMNDAYLEAKLFKVQVNYLYW